MKRNKTMPFCKIHKKQSGFGIIEAVVASALVGIAMLGFATMTTEFAQIRERNLFTNLSLQIESTIIASTADISSLQAGSIPILNDSNSYDYDLRKKYVCYPIYLSGYEKIFGGYDKITICPLTDPDSPNQWQGSNDMVLLGKWRVRLKFKKNGAVPPFKYSAAYSISQVKPKSGYNHQPVENHSDDNFEPVATTRPLGAQNFPFKDEDYNIHIPTEDTYEQSASVNAKKCDPITTFGMRGVDPATGDVMCLEQPSNICPDGTFAYDLVSKNKNLEWACSQPIKKAVCRDPMYALSKVDLKLLYRHQGVNFDLATPPGECALITQNTTDAKTYRNNNGDGFKGSVCPQGYKLKSTPQGACKIVEAKSISGTCVDYDYQTQTAFYEDPVTQKQMKKTFSSAVKKTFSSAATVGTLKYNGPINGYRDPKTMEWMLDCWLEVPAQKCGAKWSAILEVEAACEVDTSVLPLRVPASYED